MQINLDRMNRGYDGTSLPPLGYMKKRYYGPPDDIPCPVLCKFNPADWIETTSRRFFGAIMKLSIRWRLVDPAKKEINPGYIKIAVRDETWGVDTNLHEGPANQLNCPDLAYPEGHVLKVTFEWDDLLGRLYTWYLGVPQVVFGPWHNVIW